MVSTNDIINLNAAVKANPTDITARLALADAYEEQGKTRMAKRIRELAARKELELQSISSKREELINELREHCPKGSTVYCIVREVSRSGMRRLISFFAFVDNQPVYLDHLMSQALGLKRPDRKDGLVVNGCGMNMCFATVYNLSQVLYQDGYSLSQREI